MRPAARLHAAPSLITPSPVALAALCPPVALAALAALCSLAAGPLPASAQSLLVKVTEAESGRPIPGAFVSLLDGEGRVVRSALTNDSGTFLFPLVGPGSCTVRGEMIGRETRQSEAVTLAKGESGQVDLALPVRAISLAGLDVEADAQCRLRPDEASEIARVWEEASKALEVQAWAEAAGLYRRQLTAYERDLDPAGRRVEREDRRSGTVVDAIPFGSLPVEDLLTGGFVRPTGDGGYQYYGPDATTLLSDPFQATHCFQLTRSRDHPGSIGLAFEPTNEVNLPDIEGTLWLEEETARLQFLEYRYTWAPYPEAWGLASGRLEFEALPDGAWIVDRWWIRAPILARRVDMVRAGDSGIRVTGIRETGGEVTQVSTLTDESLSEAVRSTLVGVVWDSTRSAPLEGATVALSGTLYAALTDGRGRFEIDDLPEGVYTAVFSHPRLDSMGIGLPGMETEVVPGQARELRLAVPSLPTLALTSCQVGGGAPTPSGAAPAAPPRGPGNAALTGLVKDRTTGEPVPGATVTIEWPEPSPAAGAAAAGESQRRAVVDEPRLRVPTDAGGRYIACGIPSDQPLQVQASFLGWEGALRAPALPAGEASLLDLGVDLPPGLVSDRATPRALLDDEGVQGIQGILLEPGSRSPVRSAEVSLRDASGTVLATGVTDTKGFFRLRTPLPGRFLFSADALGYAGVENEVVEVVRDKLTVLEVQMAPAALELEPLVVSAERRDFQLEMQGFYQRQIESHGIFMAPEVLERRRPRKVTDLFFGLPGTTVMEPMYGAGPRAVYFRSGRRVQGICFPMVYVDRHLVATGGLGADATALDEVVAPLDVAAIEVYRTPSEIPAEFNGPNAGCGVVVIWTQRGGGG